MESSHPYSLEQYAHQKQGLYASILVPCPFKMVKNGERLIPVYQAPQMVPSHWYLRLIPLKTLLTMESSSLKPGKSLANAIHSLGMGMRGFPLTSALVSFVFFFWVHAGKKWSPTRTSHGETTLSWNLNGYFNNFLAFFVTRYCPQLWGPHQQ